MARILSISYDPHLLMSRELLLRQMGHVVVSAEGFSTAFHECELPNAGFDLIVLGHSIPHADKQEIIRRCTQANSCPIVALLRANEPPVTGAAVSVESLNAQAFMAAVQNILDGTPAVGAAHQIP
jgi:DNA-binding response OmpR family regulator